MKHNQLSCIDIKFLLFLHDATRFFHRSGWRGGKCADLFWEVPVSNLGRNIGYAFRQMATIASF
jgi:hypothetical protein